MAQSRHEPKKAMISDTLKVHVHPVIRGSMKPMANSSNPQEAVERTDIFSSTTSVFKKGNHDQTYF